MSKMLPLIVVLGVVAVGIYAHHKTRTNSSEGEFNYDEDDDYDDYDDCY